VVNSIVKSYKVILKFLLAVGVFASIHGVYYVYSVNKTQSWPSVDGVIERSFVDKSISDGRTRYRAKIRYIYSVDDISYIGDRVKFGANLNKSSAESIVKKYGIDRKVKVYFDPINPSDAVLEPGVSLIVLGYPAFGVLFVLISLFLLRFGLSQTLVKKLYNWGQSEPPPL